MPTSKIIDVKPNSTKKEVSCSLSLEQKNRLLALKPLWQDYLPLFEKTATLIITMKNNSLLKESLISILDEEDPNFKSLLLKLLEEIYL